MLNRLRISTRLYGVITILMVLLLGLGVTAWFSIQGVVRQKDNIIAAQNMNENLLQLEVAHLDWTLELARSLQTKTAFTGQLDHTLCGLGEWYYAFLDSPEFYELPPVIAQAFRALAVPHENLHSSASKMATLLEQENYSEQAWEKAYEIYTQETMNYLTQVRSGLDEIARLLGLEVVLQEELADQRVIQSTITTVVVLAVALLVAIFVGGFTVYSVCRTLRYTVARVEDLSHGEGDLTQRIPVTTSDELGHLAKNLNAFIERLQIMVGSVQSSTDQTAESSASLSATVEELSASVTEVAATTNQFASTLQEMNSNSAHLAELAKETEDQTHKGAVQITDTVEIMGQINHSMAGLGQEIQRLEEQSEQIQTIVGLITAIADQTNLLALNAAIEAARAGEQGRGFAVVAGEVRELAEQSANAAQEIRTVIGEIRRVVEETVTQADENVRRVEQGSTAVENTGVVFESIRSIVEALAGGIRSLATANEQLSSGGEEIAASSEQQSASIEQVGATANELATMAIRLQELVEQFKV